MLNWINYVITITQIKLKILIMLLLYADVPAKW